MRFNVIPSQLAKGKQFKVVLSAKRLHLLRKTDNLDGGNKATRGDLDERKKRERFLDGHLLARSG